MVRSVQTLTLLSESLKLSLLLSKSADPSLNEEALQLIERTEAEKLKCLGLLANMMRLKLGTAQDMVAEMDRAYVEAKRKHTKDDVKASNEGNATEADAKHMLGHQDDLEDDEMEDVSAG